MSVSFKEFQKLYTIRIKEWVKDRGLTLNKNMSSYYFECFNDSYYYVIEAPLYQHKKEIHFSGIGSKVIQYYFLNAMRFVVKDINKNYPKLFEFYQNPIADWTVNPANLDHFTNGNPHFRSASSRIITEMNQIDDVMDLLDQAFVMAQAAVEATNTWEKMYDIAQKLDNEGLVCVFSSQRNLIFPNAAVICRVFNDTKRMYGTKEYLKSIGYQNETMDNYLIRLENLNPQDIIAAGTKGAPIPPELPNIEKNDDEFVREYDFYESLKGAFFIKDDKEGLYYNKLIASLRLNDYSSIDSGELVFNDVLESKVSVYVGKGDGFVIVVPSYEDEDVLAVYNFRMTDIWSNLLIGLKAEMFMFASMYKSLALLFIVKNEANEPAGMMYVHDEAKPYFSKKGNIDAALSEETEGTPNDNIKVETVMYNYLEKITGFDGFENDKLQATPMIKFERI